MLIVVNEDDVSAIFEGKYETDNTALQGINFQLTLGDEDYTSFHTNLVAETSQNLLIFKQK